MNNCMGFPCSSAGKESPYNARDSSSSLDQEDSLEEGMTIHSSIVAWRILMDRGGWWATVHEGHRVDHD